MLAIQIAVPRELLGKEETEIDAFLLVVFREAVNTAAEAFRRAEIPFDAVGHLALVEALARTSQH
jgi:hypothetical protein